MAINIPRAFSGTAASRQTQVNTLLRQATTTAEVNAILAAARSSNTTIDNSAVNAANARIAAASKPVVPPTPAKPTAAPTTTPTPPKPTTVQPPASLNLPDAATAMRLILARDPKAPPTMRTDSATGTQYYLLPPTGNQAAQWVSVPRGSSVASNGQSLSAINTAQTSYLAANQTPLPRPATPPSTPVVPTQARPTLSIAEQSRIQQPILSQLNTVATQADFDSLVNQAANAGAPLNSGQISSFQNALSQRLAKSTTSGTPGGPTAAQQALYQANAKAIAGFTPPPEKSYDFSGPGSATITWVPADPITGTSGGYYIESGGGYRRLDPATGAPAGDVLSYANFNSLSRTSTANASAIINQQRQQAAAVAQDFANRLVRTQTQAELDKVIADARAANITLNEGQVSSAQKAITARAAEAERVRLEQAAQPFLEQLRNATTTGDFDKVIADAKTAGIPLNQGTIDSYRGALTGRLAQAETARLNTLRTGYLEQLRNASATMDQAAFDRVVAEAKAAGAPLSDTDIATRQTTLTNNVKIVENERRQALAGTLGEQLRNVNNQGDIDKIVAEGQAAGISFSPTQLDSAKNRVAGLDKMYGEVANIIKGSAPGTQMTSQFTPSGVELVRIPDDPTTGQKGGWFMYTGGGMRAVGADGRPVGDVLDTNTFNKNAQMVQMNVQNYERDQAEAKRIAQLKTDIERYEAQLPKPGTEQFKSALANRYMFEGPDRSVYEIMDADPKTGAPAYWVKSTTPQGATYNNIQYQRLDDPNVQFSKVDLNKAYTTNAAYRDAQAKEERARMIAEQRRAQDINVGELTKFIAGTLAVFGGAMLIANYGPALYDKMVETIATMAEGGSGAGEIADVLTNIYDVPVDLAGNLGEVATGAVEEAITSIPGIQAPPGYENVFEFGFPEVPVAPPAPPAPPVGPENVFEFGFPEVPVAPPAPPTPITPPAPPIGPENVFEFGFPEAPVAPPAPPPAPPTPPVGPENVFEYGFPETPVAPPSAPTPAPPAGPENVFEYGFPEAPVSPTPTPGELPSPIEYPSVEPPTQGPIEVAQGPSQTMTDVPVMDEPPLRIEITGLPEQTPIPEGLDYPDLGPPDYVYEPTIEPPPFGEPGPTPVAPGIPTAGPGPETVFEFGFPEVPIAPPPVSPPYNPTDLSLPGPDTTFEFGFPETPVGPPAPPSGPGGPSVPGPDTTFEFGFPETPVGPGTPGPGGPSVPGPDTTFEFGYPEVPVAPPAPTPPGPDNVFEFGYPETPPPPLPPGPDTVFEYGYPEPTPPEQPPYDYIDQDPVPEPQPEPPYDYIDQDPVPPKSPIEELIDTIKDIPTPPIIPIVPIAPTPPTPPEYGPLGPIDWGKTGAVNLPGVNPGFFTTPSPYYQTTSPVQSRYSWRQRPLQTGSEYSAALYNAPSIGPAVPFGLQEMYTPLDIQQYLQTLNSQTPLAGSSR